MSIGIDDVKNAMVGEAVLAEAKSNPSFRGQLQKIIEDRISDSNQRFAGLSKTGDHMETGD